MSYSPRHSSRLLLPQWVRAEVNRSSFGYQSSLYAQLSISPLMEDSQPMAHYSRASQPSYSVTGYAANRNLKEKN